jgi:hypothetical protein
MAMSFVNKCAFSYTIASILLKSLTFTKSRDKNDNVVVVSLPIEQSRIIIIKKKIEEKGSEWKRAEEYCASTKAKNESRHDDDVSVEREGARRITTKNESDVMMMR